MWVENLLICRGPTIGKIWVHIVYIKKNWKPTLFLAEVSRVYSDLRYHLDPANRLITTESDISDRLDIWDKTDIFL